MLITNCCAKKVIQFEYCIKSNNEMLPDLLVFSYATKA